MRIEKLSIRLATVMIFFMIGIFAVILSLLAGAYFKQAALDAQMNSLSRVIEVATDEMLKGVRANTFDLGMRLAYSGELIEAFSGVQKNDDQSQLLVLLDDPFINGFVGFQNINLEKIRVYDLQLEFVAESNRGIKGLDRKLDHHLVQQISKLRGIDRLKAMDDLWMSSKGPLYSTLVPIGGLRILGYLEVIIDPAHNLPEIGKITKTPVSIFSSTGHPLNISQQDMNGFLPVKYTLLTSDGEPAYRIVGYENVDKLNQEMGATQVITTMGFLVLTLMVLLFALKLFQRFLFSPVSQMIVDMEQMAHGNLDLKVNKKGLKEFYILAEAFNLMADQVRVRTNELHDSQNRLLQLLDLDNSAILCFGHKNDVVYFNKGASDIFGYANDEINDLEFSDLFADDITRLNTDDVLQTRLQCLTKDGRSFLSDAIINALSVMGESGFAVVLNSVLVRSDEATVDSVVNNNQSAEQG
ncbi:MAG: PAS domain S-box protein, partial [Gammaproteobacteria bacterium]|nr:PAS domain S-box protein [Gammaproteobacteria bacterium]